MNTNMYISQEALMELVDTLCKESVHGVADIAHRTSDVFEQYHKATDDKFFVYKSVQIGFRSLNTKSLEEHILKILRTNLSGQIMESFTLTRALWNGQLKDGTFIINSDSSKVYYRTRNSDKELISPEKLFHAPFELRTKAKTARYSVLGFPSLYLTRNLYVAWEESRREDIKTLYASRLELKRPLKLLDLRLRRSFENVPEDSLKRVIQPYLLTIPLIIACSLKVQNDDHPFKPEYIITQQILHSIIDEMIQRTKVHPAARGFASDSSMHSIDELLTDLAQKFDNNITKMEDAVKKWANSVPKSNFVESSAASMLYLMTLSKYGCITREQRMPINDRDWRLYCCAKGLRQFAQNGVDGIIYSSTRTERIHWRDTPINTDCIVVPIHSCDEKGYCRFLSRAFTITAPTHNNTVVDEGVDLLAEQEYGKSYFKQLEDQLSGMPLFHMEGLQNKKLSKEGAQEKVKSLLKGLAFTYPQHKDRFVIPQIADLLRQLLCSYGEQSLLQQMQEDIQFISTTAKRGGMSFWNFGDGFNHKLVILSDSYMGLVKKNVKTIVDNRQAYSFEPLEGANTQSRRLSYAEWYNEKVFELGKFSLSRKEIVEIITNEDGIWANPQYGEAFEFFSQPNSLNLEVNGEQIRFDNNPIYVSLAQIAWEIMESLKSIH